MQFAKVLITLVTAALVAADVKTVVSDASDIKKSIDDLYSAIKDIDGTNIFSDLSLKLKADALTKELDTAAGNIQALNGTKKGIDTKSASTILTTLNSSFPTIKKISAKLVAIEPGLRQSDVAGIAKSALNNVANGTTVYATAVLKIAPAKIRVSGRALLKNIQAELTKMTKAYAKD